MYIFNTLTVNKEKLSYCLYNIYIFTFVVAYYIIMSELVIKLILTTLK